MLPTILDVRTQAAAHSRSVIAPGLVRTLGDSIAQACPDASRLMVASSPRVWALHGDAVVRGLGVALPAQDQVGLVNDG
ncbi:MAG: hypothetical protein ACR2LU_10475, partial [Luteitalea sp.]